jgi:hypothetical protein
MAIRSLPHHRQTSSAAWFITPYGEWSGRRKVRFARLMQRPGRVLGGPVVRAACGGNLKPALVAT